MKFKTLLRTALLALLLHTVSGAGAALAQSQQTQAQPTLTQVYALTNARKLDRAQVLMDQVLAREPNSAEAHFVQAELFARMGELARARASLATAEKLAPGLGFARAESVQALRSQTAEPNLVGAGQGLIFYRGLTPEASDKTSLASAGWTLLVVGGGLAVGFVLYRRRSRGQRGPEQPPM
jgi:tetratricopeptide (TPR) repeat protein